MNFLIKSIWHLWRDRQTFLTFSAVLLRFSLSLQNSSMWLRITNEEDEKQGNFFMGTYKGDSVAVKKIDKKTVELNRDVLLELKQVNIAFYSKIFKKLTEG